MMLKMQQTSVWVTTKCLICIDKMAAQEETFVFLFINRQALGKEKS